MRKLSTFFIAAAGIISLCSAALQAATIPFLLDGTAGFGLLPGNQNPPADVSSSGGIGAGGISFDTISKVLSIDVRWGSSNGFTDLTGNGDGMHIHLPTANPATDGFSENASPSIFLDSLSGYDPSATSGSFIGVTLALSGSQEAAILGSRSYINVHTLASPGGEIRGHLVALAAIPEPATLTLVGWAIISFVALGTGRRRRLATAE